MLNFQDNSVVIRVMDEASPKVFALSNLKNHLVHGVLSSEEMKWKWIKPRYSIEWLVHMYTPFNEISVYSLQNFKFVRFTCGDRAIWVFLPQWITRNSNVKHDQVWHPVIVDTVPIEQRKILWIYCGEESYLDWIKGLLAETKKQIPIYWSNFEQIR